MDILKSATEWAKSEVFSAQFFIFFGIAFAIASFGFWQLGKTELAKAFIIPSFVVGGLLMTIGIGLVYTNKMRLKQFPKDYENNPTEFVQTEIIRAEKTIKEFKTVVYKAIPIIVIACALLIMLVDKPIWRAIAIVTIGMLFVIFYVDTNSDARIKAYHKELIRWETND